jgi:hypothetical protein
MGKKAMKYQDVLNTGMSEVLMPFWLLINSDLITFDE